jgi:DNA polymerase-3 subunit gamma/tau
VQLYYQIALGGRRDLPMAPEPRLGFEMSLLRMLAFRPEASAVEGPGRQAAGGAPPAAWGAGAVPAVPVARAAPAPPASSPPASAVVPAAAAAPAPRPAAVDPANWAAVVESANLLGMVRQFALNCVPASFDGRLLRLRFDESAAHRRTPQIEEKLVQGLSGYLGTEIRVAFEPAEAALATPARHRVLAEQERASRAAAAFEDDAAVKGLRERFGAEIDAASVKPAT